MIQILVRLYGRFHLLCDMKGNIVFHSGSRSAVDVVVIADKPVRLYQLEGSCGRHLLSDLRCFQKAQRPAEEIVLFQTHMSLRLAFGDCVHQRFVDTLRGNGGKPQTHCQLVSCLECDTCHFHQLVRMLPDDIQSILSILTVDLNGSVGGNTVGSQKGNHVPGAAGGQIGIRDHPETPFADAPNGYELLRLLIQNLQRVLAEGIVDFLCDFSANAFDLTGGQIADDAFSGMGNYLLVALYLELESVLRMSGPVAIQTESNFFRDGEAIADSLELAHGIAAAIVQDFQRTVNGDHIVNGGSIGHPGVDELIKLT